MKTMDFLTLLGELDETATVSVKNNKKRRPLRVAAAACLCACILGCSAWFFLPPMVNSSNSVEITTIRIVSRLVCYRVVNTEHMSRFERSLLPDTPGEVLCTHGDTTFYGVEGAEDLMYLLGEADGDYTLYEFDHITSLVGVDMSESHWYDMGWLTDEDLAALDYETSVSMGEILSVIYSATSAEDVASIRFDKSPAYQESITKKVKVSPVTVKEAEDTERLYTLIAAMTPVSLSDRESIDFGTVGIHDTAYTEGSAPLSAQVNRRMTVNFRSGHSLILYYYPATGLLCQKGRELYTVLSDAENGWLITLAEIDMEWHDWGTEKIPAKQKGEGDETATVPAVPDAQ